MVNTIADYAEATSICTSRSLLPFLPSLKSSSPPPLLHGSPCSFALHNVPPPLIPTPPFSQRNRMMRMDSAR